MSITQLEKNIAKKAEQNKTSVNQLTFNKFELEKCIKCSADQRFYQTWLDSSGWDFVYNRMESGVVDRVVDLVLVTVGL